MASPYAALIVGLGNPGREYARTRHNVGFMVVDELAAKHGIKFTRRQGKAEIADGTIAGLRVLLAKPQTYVNLSGEAVAVLIGFTRLEPAQCIIVCDDLDLPLGTLRIREKGGSGGHNGLKSISQRLHTQEFPRIRIGIGRPGAEEVLGRSDELVTSHVLSSFSASERDTIGRAVARAVEAIEMAVAEGIALAMNRYNEPSRPTAG